MRVRYLAALLLAVPDFASVAHGQALKNDTMGPSFACTPRKGVVAATICSSPSLSAADREMAALYSADRLSAFDTGPSNVLVSQRQTLKKMQDCAKSSQGDSVAHCLQRIYDDRNYDLAVDAVTRSPDLALPVIRRFHPAFARVVEAIMLWASEPQSTDWSSPVRAEKRAKILNLLKPSWTDLLTKEGGFFRDTMDEAAPAGQSVRKLEDLLASPGSLAAFLNVLGPLESDRGDFGGVIPCAAIVRHPALLDATQSIFGATPDNFVLYTNCEETLPPTPALTALDSKLNKGWPVCEGTIRFGAYRHYQMNLDAARLGMVQHDPKARFPSRRGVTLADVSAVRSELAIYYKRYLGRSPSQASQMAADAVSAVLTTAQECE